MGHLRRRLKRALAALALGSAASSMQAAEVELLSGPTSRAGERMVIALAVRDPTTGWPLDGLALRAWLRAPLGAQDACLDVAGRLARSGVDPRRALALHAYDLLALGEDGTLAVVDPRLDLATANLVRIERLDGSPAAMALDVREAVLWATLPATDKLVRHDLAAGTAPAAIDLPGGPRALAGPWPDGSLAVGLDEAGAVTLVGPEGGERARRTVGDGRVALAWTEERLVALTLNDGTLTVLDPATLEVLSRIAVSGPATAMALADEQDLALVADGRGGISMVALEAGAELLGRVPLGITADRLAVTSDGRWLSALDRGRSTLAIVDLAHGRVAHALTFEDGAEELLVGPDLLYVRLRDAPAVAILALASLAADREPVVERVVMGSASTGGRDRLLMTLGPGGRSLHLAHPVDRRVYLFTGGSMRAPVSAVPLKGVVPAALALRPRQPQPMGDGGYRAVVEAPGPGRYSLVVALDRPPEAHCIDLVVEGEPDPRSAVLTSAPRLEAELAGQVVANRESTILLQARRVPDRAPVAESLGMVAVMALRVGGSWQQRTVASPLGEGRYAARLRFPAPGRYLVLAEAPAAGLGYDAGPRLLVEVGGERAP
jgi:hypothetical protein